MISLHETQKAVVNDAHRFRVVVCGRRWGKSTLAILEMLGKAYSTDDARVAFFANTYQQARDIVWSDLRKYAQSSAVAVNEQRLEMTVRNRFGGTSQITLRGWESVETMRGLKFHFLVLDEVASMRGFVEAWQEVVRPTLTDYRGEALFLSTPKGFNDLYDLYGMEAKDKDYKSFHFTSYDNPHVPADELDKARKELTEDRFAQEYLADFRKTEGLVYKEFERRRHMYRDGEGPAQSVRRLVGVDWGYTNPTAVLEVVEDADRTFWVASEWYRTGKTTPEIVERAASLAGSAYYPDPAEPDRVEELRRAGLNVQEVSKDVEAGIDTVRQLLKTGRLRIHESCRNLIAEFETYSYKERKPGQNEPEEPIKDNDHALDALRYVLHMAAYAQWGRAVAQSRPSPVTYGRRPRAV